MNLEHNWENDMAVKREVNEEASYFNVNNSQSVNHATTDNNFSVSNTSNNNSMSINNNNNNNNISNNAAAVTGSTTVTAGMTGASTAHNNTLTGGTAAAANTAAMPGVAWGNNHMYGYGSTVAGGYQQFVMPASTRFTPMDFELFLNGNREPT